MFLFRKPTTHQRSHGVITIMFVLLLLPLLGFFCYGMNVIFYQLQLASLQTAADSLALANALEVSSNPVQQYPNLNIGNSNIITDNFSYEAITNANVSLSGITDTQCPPTNNRSGAKPYDCAASIPDLSNGSQVQLTATPQSLLSASNFWGLNSFGAMTVNSNAAVWDYEWNSFTVVPPRLIIVADYSASMRLPYPTDPNNPGAPQVAAENDLRTAILEFLAGEGNTFLNMGFLPFSANVLTPLKPLDFASYQVSSAAQASALQANIANQLNDMNGLVRNTQTVSDDGTDMAQAINVATSILTSNKPSASSSLYPFFGPMVMLIVSDGSPNYDAVTNVETPTDTAENNASNAVSAAWAQNIQTFVIQIQHAAEQDANATRFLQGLAGSGSQANINNYVLASKSGDIGNIIQNFVHYPHCVSNVPLSLNANNPWLRYPKFTDPLYAFFINIDVPYRTPTSTEHPVSLRWVAANPKSAPALNVSVVSRSSNAGDPTDSVNPNTLVAYYYGSSYQVELNYQMCQHFINKPIGYGPGFRLRWGLPLLYNN